MKTKIFRKNHPSSFMKIMRLALLLLPLLGRGLGGGGALVAQTQNGVTVSGLEVNSGTVTFNVSWDKNAMPATPWSDTVWVFVDYNKNGVMTRLPVTSATATAGTVTKIPGNDKGVWVAGDARTNDSFSAKVELFTEIKDVAGACAYASNYPPVGEYTAADKIEFTGTPEYTILIKRDADEETETRTGSSLFTVPPGYTAKSFTDKTGAPGKFSCIPSATFTLTASAAGFCTGEAGVTFSLSGTQADRSYELYKDGAPTAVATLTGSGSAQTFTTPINVPGSYTAKVLASASYCEAEMSGAPVVNVLPVPTITHVSTSGAASQAVDQSTAIIDIVYSTTYSAVISGSGFPTGVDGTPSGTPTGTSYTISGTPSATGMFGYSLTAEVNGCTSAATVGTITVNAVGPPGTIPLTLCPQCCYDGSAWVDCYVTTDAVSTAAQWIGNSNTTYFSGASGSGSDKNGRKNFNAITASSSNYTSNSAVGYCKALGDGWYLPAYEELYAMSSGGANSESNNQAGAQILTDGYHWSSTELYENGGRVSYSDLLTRSSAVRVSYNANMGNYGKAYTNYVRCAWREADPPPGAASTQTWTFGEQTWSDRIVATPSNCTSISHFSPETVAEYRIYDTRLYYSWLCAYNNANAFCPSPWRLPSLHDFSTLTTTLEGAGAQLKAAWGFGGFAQSYNVNVSTTQAYYWSATADPDRDRAYWHLYYASDESATASNRDDTGMQVRCVK